VEYIHVPEYRVQWRTPVNTAGSIKYGEFFDQLSDCLRMRKDSVPRS
jgi:hypothetical protein